jgi:hypothetical protein
MLMLIIVAAFITAIAEWQTGGHTERSRRIYQAAFGTGAIAAAAKALSSFF